MLDLSAQYEAIALEIRRGRLTKVLAAQQLVLGRSASFRANVAQVCGKRTVCGRRAETDALEWRSMPGSVLVDVTKSSWAASLSSPRAVATSRRGCASPCRGNRNPVYVQPDPSQVEMQIRGARAPSVALSVRLARTWIQISCARRKARASLS